jgi:hypothetical protein
MSIEFDACLNNPPVSGKSPDLCKPRSQAPSIHFSPLIKASISSCSPFPSGSTRLFARAVHQPVLCPLNFRSHWNILSDARSTASCFPDTFLVRASLSPPVVRAIADRRESPPVRSAIRTIPQRPSSTLRGHPGFEIHGHGLIAQIVQRNFLTADSLLPNNEVPRFFSSSVKRNRYSDPAFSTLSRGSISSHPGENGISIITSRA